jgi:hypothetical protein
MEQMSQAGAAVGSSVTLIPIVIPIKARALSLSCCLRSRLRLASKTQNVSVRILD